MSSETPLLVTFWRGSKPTGRNSRDGLPVYESCIMITVARPPWLKLERVATDEEMELYADAYKAFLKTDHARSPNLEGYPLANWPVINAAHLDMFAARDIFTVEQLAKLSGRRDLPPDMLEIAGRAKAFVEMQGSTGKYENLVREKDQVIEALSEENTHLKRELTKATQTLNLLREKVA
jgi:hypothetical protein